MTPDEVIAVAMAAQRNLYRVFQPNVHSMILGVPAVFAIAQGMGLHPSEAMGHIAAYCVSPEREPDDCTVTFSRAQHRLNHQGIAGATEPRMRPQWQGVR